ncbi:MAG: hypothetical protein IJH53_05035 [Oscillospiraceae bacterium]|nr:hypothetical protein [Oscillospiraceae bacterium]
MKRETITFMLNSIGDEYIGETEVFRPYSVQGSPERTDHMKKRRIITLLLAAVLMLALGITAYAVWNIHTERQQQLKSDLKIEENNVTSYTEYDVPEEQEGGLVLLSSVNDGQVQHVYVNISPVTKEEAARFPADGSFAWSIAGTEIGGFAAPQLPVELSLSGEEAIRDAVMENAYDEESQTMTLQCYIDVKFLEKAAAELGTEAVPLQVHLIAGENTARSFGPVSLSLTEKQSRHFDFGHAVYHDEELDKDIEIVGLELTPFSAVWKVRYEGAAAFHTPEADWEAYQPWSMLEDKVCIEAKLVFPDGSAFSTSGAMTCPYEDGVVKLNCAWGSAINIEDVQKIILGDLVLWENK